MSTRRERVAAAIRRSIAELVLYEMRDPRLAQATITAVSVSRDLAVAKVYVSALGDEAALRAAVQALADAAGWVRRRIAPELSLRQVPELVFYPDDSAARAQRLDRLFREEAREFDEAAKDEPSDE